MTLLCGEKDPKSFLKCDESTVFRGYIHALSVKLKFGKLWESQATMNWELQKNLHLSSFLFDYDVDRYCGHQILECMELNRCYRFDEIHITSPKIRKSKYCDGFCKWTTDAILLMEMHSTYLQELEVSGSGLDSLLLILLP